MSKSWVPVDFQPPLEVLIGDYKLRPLTEAYVDVDLAAVNSSVDIIKLTRGGTWPKGMISFEEDMADLAEHRQEFERRSSFAYCILAEDEKTCAGSIYLYPPNHPFDDSDKSLMPVGGDAVVSFWVSQASYDEGFYPELYVFITKWLESWPFKNPFISNIKKP